MLMQALKLPVDTKLFTGMGGVAGGGDAADEYRRSLLPPLLENTGFDLNTALQYVVLRCEGCMWRFALIMVWGEGVPLSEGSGIAHDGVPCWCPGTALPSPSSPRLLCSCLLSTCSSTRQHRARATTRLSSWRL